VQKAEELHQNISVILRAVCRVSFFGWQALMIYWLSTFIHNSKPPTEIAPSDTSMAAAAYTFIALYEIFIIFVWLAGSLILGLVVFLTRKGRMGNSKTYKISNQ
jgi:hypothetical protein